MEQAADQGILLFPGSSGLSDFTMTPLELLEVKIMSNRIKRIYIQSEKDILNLSSRFR